MRWAGYFEGVVLATLHVVAAFGALVLGFAVVVRGTGEPGSITVVALFISLPVLIQGMLALAFGGYGRVPTLGWVLTGMREGMGVVFLAFLFLGV